MSFDFVVSFFSHYKSSSETLEEEDEVFSPPDDSNSSPPLDVLPFVSEADEAVVCAVERDATESVAISEVLPSESGEAARELGGVISGEDAAEEEVALRWLRLIEGLA